MNYYSLTFTKGQNQKKKIMINKLKKSYKGVKSKKNGGR